MSWLISMVLAGMVFATESGLPLHVNSGFIETNKMQVVRLDETERFEQTYPLNPNGRISVSNVNGSITVEAWDRNEVKLVAIKTADTRERLKEVQIKIDSRPDYLRVETEYEDHRRTGVINRDYQGKLEVQYQLTVPRGAVLNEIETVNGSVTVSNTTNITKVSAVNGQVKAVNLRGTASLETVNGNVDADFNTLQTGSQITLNTVNGRANLLIPSDASVTIRADSLNGNIINDFGLPVRKGQYVGRDLYGRVGSGDVRIKLSSVNGELAVRRKQDGKTPLPSTNLLQGTTTVYGVDAEAIAAAKVRHGVVKPLKMKPAVKPLKEPLKAAKVDIVEFNAEVAKAMKEAQKELAKTKVHIDAAELNKQMQKVTAQQLELARLTDTYWFAGTPAIEKKSDSFPVKGVPRVTIEAKNCSVAVRGWDKPEVSYSITKFSRAAGQTALDTKVTNTETDVNIKVTDTGKLPGNLRVFGDASRVRIEVYVPKKSNLRIRTDGEIRLENVSGEIDLQGAEEAVNVRDVDGKLSVGTTEGRIRVIGFQGALTAKTTEGMMSLEGDFDMLSAQTADGTIVLTLPETANANIESNLENITGEGITLDLLSSSRNISKWKIGSGGNNYRLYSTAEGQVIIRGSGNLTASN